MASSSSVSQPWPTSAENYVLENVIGKGATAVVYSAMSLTKNEKCAIKVVPLESMHTCLQSLMEEIQALRNCKHKNILKYFTSFVVRYDVWIVMELLEGGSLLDVIRQKMKMANCRFGVLDEPTIATVLYNVLKGLEYFHGNGGIHRDIKAANILLGADGTVELGDFGVSTYLEPGKNSHIFVGTPCWMAPEVAKQEHGYDFKADIWSLGITAIELATGFAPNFMLSPQQVLIKTILNDPPTLETEEYDPGQYTIAYGRTFRSMIADCLQKDPKNRPTATELLRHPFFKKAKDRKHLLRTLVPLGARTLQNKSTESSPAMSLRSSYDIVEWNFDDSSNDGEEAAGVDVSQQPDSSIDRHIDDSNLGPATPNQTREDSQEVLNLKLRLRNSNNELIEVFFEYIVGKHTPTQIADELVSAALIDSRDSVPVSINLGKLLKHRSLKLPAEVTFLLNTASPKKIFDDKNLFGFARISIII